MVYIILSLVCVAIVLASNPSWRLKYKLLYMFSLLLASILALLLVFTMTGSDAVIAKGEVATSDRAVWLEIALYLVMVGGMGAKLLFDAIGESKGVAPRLDKWQLVRPLTVSPIVFGLIYGTAGEQAGGFLLLIFAFQNGFFWQTVLPSLRLQ
jgi:hypothetical protein